MEHDPGVEGNERLTAASAALLFVLLAVEGLTIVFLRPLFDVHVFVGMLLVPVLVAKLASTGYRFLRYYAGAPAYRRKGPPHPALRLLAPLLVAATVVLMASGILLVVEPTHSALLITVHQASFVVWFALASVHVLAYVWRLPRALAPDWRRSRLSAVRRGGPGRWATRLRRGWTLAALAAGVALAAVTLPLAGPWLSGATPR